MKYAASLLVYALVFAISPILVGALAMWHSMAGMLPEPSSLSIPGDLPPRPPHDYTLPTAVVLLGTRGTEVTDFLAPYAIFARAGTHNVYAVSAKRTAIPLNGGVDVLPHLTFDELDEIGEAPQVLFVPNIAFSPDDENVRWIRKTFKRGSIVVAICEGARAVAATRLLDGHRATSHFYAIGDLEGLHPDVRWLRGERYVDEGILVSSAGVTAAFDVSLHLLRRLEGEQVADHVASDLVYSEKPTSYPPPAFRGTDYLMMLLNAGFVWPKRTIAVQLDEGVDEVALAALLDTLPRSFLMGTTTVASRPIVRTRHGVWLLPRHLGSPEGAGVAIRTGRGSEFAFDRALTTLAVLDAPATAAFVAKMIDYPVSFTDAWPHGRLAAALGFGGLVVLAVGASLRGLRGRAPKSQIGVRVRDTER